MIKKIPYCALCALVLSACGGGSGDTNLTPYPTTSFSGTVRYQGAPVAGVTVVAYATNSNAPAATTVTDTSGNYSFSGLDVSCTDNCVAVFNFFAFKSGYSFTPVLAGDPTGNRSNLEWGVQAYGWNVATGDAVARAGFNGAFTNPDNGTGAPINFNVITFTSLAGDSQSNGDFNGYNGAHPVVQLAATGQTTSYAAGDDGELKQGVAWPGTRYTDNGDGTVTDHLTGLVWLKNAACFTAATWSNAVADANQLASGQCGLTDGSITGQWRLPNLIELESLIDTSARAPVVDNIFVNVPTTASTSVYWTSTPYWSGAGPLTTSAWAIRLSDGRYINGNDTNGSNLMTSASNGVWAVRGTGSGTVALAATGAIEPFAPSDDGTLALGAPIPQARFIANGDGTVTDSLTGLIWLQKADCFHDIWTNVLGAITTLASGQCGLSDGSSAGQWRMPNRNEMQSLQDRGQNNHALYFGENFDSAFPSAIPSQQAIFISMPELQYYWTSTTNASSTGEAWAVYSCDFGVYDIDKTDVLYSLAVRGP